MSTASLFNDFYKNFADTTDTSAFAETNRSNIEAGSKAFQLGVETLQALSTRGTEIARKNSEQLLAAAQDATTSGTPEAGVARSTEAAKSLIEDTVVNLREVSEVLTKTSFEAFDLISSRAADSLTELSQATTANKKRK